MRRSTLRRLRRHFSALARSCFLANLAMHIKDAQVLHQFAELVRPRGHRTKARTWPCAFGPTAQMC